MRKTIKLIFFSICILMLCQACDSPSPKPPAPEQKPKSQQTAPQQHTKKPAESKNVWPPVRDNQEVTIAKNLLAKNYYVVLDCSGSMSQFGCSGGIAKLNAAKAALAKFAQLVPSDANLGLMAFQGGKIYELVPFGIGNRDQFVSATNSTKAGGGTPLHSALKAGYLEIEKQARRQLGYGEYILVIVTDGEASEGQDPTKMVYQILDDSPVQIHTIGFCIGTDHSLNIPGRTVYKPADSPEQLQEGLQDVLAEAETFNVSDFKE